MHKCMSGLPHVGLSPHRWACCAPSPPGDPGLARWKLLFCRCSVQTYFPRLQLYGFHHMKSHARTHNIGSKKGFKFKMIRGQSWKKRERNTQRRERDKRKEAWWEAELDYRAHAGCAIRRAGFGLSPRQFLFLETYFLLLELIMKPPYGGAVTTEGDKSVSWSLSGQACCTC